LPNKLLIITELKKKGLISLLSVYKEWKKLEIFRFFSVNSNKIAQKLEKVAKVFETTKLEKKKP